ncbi:hypothetical protein NDU88_004928 [Pleurodeles waltl]|uniref:Uncharacterized protein n=1 Tax=Pleurodeles waltl TaxID=8319 RepID=A0AAV7L2V5_PLEWA|nr:hypothetical protein NDU88_004928 [Pleurodeles waltl]
MSTAPAPPRRRPSDEQVMPPSQDQAWSERLSEPERMCAEHTVCYLNLITLCSHEARTPSQAEATCIILIPARPICA